MNGFFLQGCDKLQQIYGADSRLSTICGMIFVEKAVHEPINNDLQRKILQKLYITNKPYVRYLLHITIRNSGTQRQQNQNHVVTDIYYTLYELSSRLVIQSFSVLGWCVKSGRQGRVFLINSHRLSSALHNSIFTLVNSVTPKLSVFYFDKIFSKLKIIIITKILKKWQDPQVIVGRG
jgi:hypothetical protein